MRNNDPVREHLDTRSEREIAWQIRFLANTRQRLLRRPPNSINPPLTAEQVDRACLKAERELATYRLAQMVIEGMSRGKRRECEMRVAKTEDTAWSAIHAPREPQEQPEYASSTVTR